MMGVQTIIRKTRTLIKQPKSLLINTLRLLSPFMSDRLYLKLLFPLGTGYRLNLKNPQTYNQKLQWLNLNYRDPLLCKLADKHDVKNYVKEMIGEEYVVKSYGVWRSFEEIDFNTLPAQFVLKTTHDSGGIVICKDKSTLDLEKAREKINRHLKKNLFYTFREWVYKNIEPRIIAEEFLVDESKVELKDYKFFCFNGEPKAMFIATGRQSGNTMFDFYDISFNHLDIIQGYPQSGKIVEKPKNYALMVELAGKLSKGLPHVRIDFYNIDGKILFGEYTFFHFAGIEPFQPQKWDYEFGSWIDLDALVNNKKK
ncbi:MAG TPA: ATP-grasp fold amidoligase family protein [Niabella sp.]|nr:ATP-grasp fold amidoligase family protein [Niabella sp.]